MDAYIKLYLLPDAEKTTKQKTKIVRKTLAPTYNETVSGCVSCEFYEFSVCKRFITTHHMLIPSLFL